MIRAGKLDRLVTIETVSEDVQPSGAVQKVWTAHATVRAERLEHSEEDALTAFGEDTADRVVLKLRYLASVTTGHRAIFEGQRYEIERIAEIGRRRGLILTLKAMP